MNKFLSTILASGLSLCLAFFPGSSQAGIALQINNASVDTNTGTLTLHGINFLGFGVPTVAIGDVLLSGCTPTAAQIQCPLTGTPALATGGSWMVSVSAGNAPHANATIDVFIPNQTAVQQCFAGDAIECYSGDPATRGIADCRPGIRLCEAGGIWSACQGEVTPQPETCGFGADEDCDTLIDFGDPDCPASLCTDLGRVVCGTDCVDTSSDPLHCGSCLSACGTDHICVAGQCDLSCTAPTYDCGGGYCSNLASDPQNCGRCGDACAAGQSCVAGQCQ